VVAAAVRVSARAGAAGFDCAWGWAAASRANAARDRTMRVTGASLKEVKTLSGGLARWDVGPRELLSAVQGRPLQGQRARRLERVRRVTATSCYLGGCGQCARAWRSSRGGDVR